MSGSNPYSSDHSSPTARGDSFTLKERNQLGEYRQRGLLRFRDTNAFFCSACYQVFGAYCPNCKVRANANHSFDGETVFRDEGSLDNWNGFIWRQVTCLKCDYSFKVIFR